MMGYDLRKYFDESVRHFRHAGQSQIYRPPSKLKGAGWVERKIKYQHDRPDRKVHNITEAGKQAIKEWIYDPPPLGHPHSAPLIQDFFSGTLSGEQMLDMVPCNR